jgi:DNA repair ATPase RecN
MTLWEYIFALLECLFDILSAKPEEIYQREHELGLLHILIRKYPQEVQKIVEKWKLNVA